MQKSDKSQKATSARRKVQASTARNRKSVKREKPEVIIEKAEEKVEVVVPEQSKAVAPKQAEAMAESKEEAVIAKAEEKVEKSPKITKFSIEVVEEPTLEKAIKEAKPEKKITVVEKEETEIKPEATKPSKVINIVELEDEDECEEAQASAEQSSDITEVVTEKQKIEAEVAEKQEATAVRAEAATKQEELPRANMGHVYSRMRNRSVATGIVSKKSAQEIKQQEISKVLANAAKNTERQVREKPARRHFGMDWKRMVLALSCTAAAVAAIVYFVNLNAPDISLRVAAMQTGIEASYPSYIPRDYALSDIASESGKVVMNFKNSSTGAAYTITEEKSSWDSDALLTNYVRKTFGDDYATIKEQGLTIYIAGSNAAWVNGGVVYKIKTTSGSLTKKQITTIATSL